MSEFQAAFEVSQIIESQRERSPEEIANQVKINTAKTAGKFVIAEDFIKHCPFTDASMGVERWYLSEHDSYEEASNALQTIYAEEQYPCCDGYSII